MKTPPPLIDKAESRRIRIPIHKVPLEMWDPIGVKDEPNARDEYDGYIERLYELLVRREVKDRFSPRPMNSGQLVMKIGHNCRPASTPKS